MPPKAVCHLVIISHIAQPACDLVHTTRFISIIIPAESDKSTGFGRQAEFNKPASGKKAVTVDRAEAARVTIEHPTTPSPEAPPLRQLEYRRFRVGPHPSIGMFSPYIIVFYIVHAITERRVVIPRVSGTSSLFAAWSRRVSQR